MFEVDTIFYHHHVVIDGHSNYMDYAMDGLSIMTFYRIGPSNWSVDQTTDSTDLKWSNVREGGGWG